MCSKEELSHKEYYEYTTRQLEKELTLINNRLSWMLTFEGFLFTAIALVANKSMDQGIRLVFRNVIPFIGIVVAFLALVGVHGAYLSSSHIKSKWRQKPEHHQFPPPYGTPTATLLGRITSYGIPSSIVIAWLLLLVGLVTTNVAS